MGLLGEFIAVLLEQCGAGIHHLRVEMGAAPVPQFLQRRLDTQTGPVWPVRVRSPLPAVASHIFSVWSWQAETIQAPSGLTAQP